MPRHPPDIHTLAWPASRSGEALEILGRKSGLLSRPLEAPPMPAHMDLADNERLAYWIDIAAHQLELEAEPTEALYHEIDQFIHRAGPALLRLPPANQEQGQQQQHQQDEPRLLVLLKGGWRYVQVIAPNLSVRRIRSALLREALCQHLEAPLIPAITQILAEADVPEKQRPRAQCAILNQWLGTTRIGGCWILRLSPGSSMWRQMRHARLPGYVQTLLRVYLIRLALDLFAWWMIGWGALQGHFEWAWLWAWALILLTEIPFQLLANSSEHRFAIGAGALFKLRLMHGTLNLDPEEIRHQGAGQFLDRVMDAEAVELLALEGGFRVLFGTIEMILAAVVLSLGAGGGVHALLFAVWIGVMVALSWRYFHHSQDWVNAHQVMTNDLVERMVGHRTRLAQEDQATWHDDEDQSLAHYLKLSQRLDRIGLQIQTFIPHGWLFLGLSGIVYGFIAPTGSITSLAISLGGFILASQALASLTGGVQSIVNVLIAWKQISPLYQAAARPFQGATTTPRASDVVLLSDTDNHTTPGSSTAPPTHAAPGARSLLIARDLSFRYPNRSQPVLNGCHLTIRQGERLLLEGPSGGGKSTLAAILIGLRKPDSGLLLLHGFDQQTIGNHEWRRRVVSAPQFHENHVLTATFGFNLLMGRGWPPSPEDLHEAETICRELGLGDLLDRMPAGLQQMVGESGWQLSHGERSRLYIARALLQRADVIVLDESFASLDPENLQRALQCVLNRAPSLLVIAHP